MCAAAALRARRLRADKPGPVWGVGAGGGDASGGARVGISSPNIGRALPRLARLLRRALARTACTMGCSFGDGTPATALSAAMALQRAFVWENPTLPVPLCTRNSAKTIGFAGSHGEPCPAANSDQARSGPMYRFHVWGARLSETAAISAADGLQPDPDRRRTASRSISAAVRPTTFVRRGHPARRCAMALRISSRERSSCREGGPAGKPDGKDKRTPRQPVGMRGEAMQDPRCGPQDA